MNRRSALLTCLAPALAAQNSKPDIFGRISGGEPPVIAIPDLRGSGGAQPLMASFNQTLTEEIRASGVLTLAAKSFYPLAVPQQPADWKPQGSGASQGLAFADWSQPPVKTNYIAIGYTAVQNGQLVLFGWLFNVGLPDAASAQLFGKVYNAPLDAAGAIRVAREFAADILARFGAKSLLGSKIYFVSNRSGAKEIWSMDYDGSNQKQLTRYNSICITPGLSADNSKIAFTSYLQGSPGITMLTTDSARRLTFVNPQSSMVATPDFSPDGKTILFATKIASSDANIFKANTDGSNMTRVTSARANETEPKFNPKNPSEVVFISGRSGTGQIYRMNSDGADVQRLTDGSGQAANPSWHPDGKFITFAWTRGYEPGNFNLFLMNVATQQYDQLTTGSGRNINPTWAPDARHLVFCSNRSGSVQIWSMLANGTEVKQLTTVGRNEMPVWSH